MLRTVFIVISCLFISTSAVEAQELYHNEVMNFSFTLPEGWEITHKDKLPVKVQNRLQSFFDSDTAICQEIGANYFSYPCIQIETTRFERTTDFEAERTLISDENEKRTLKSAKDLASWLTKKIKNKVKQVESDFYYDTTKHIATGRITLRHEDKGNIVVIIAKLLGNSRMTVLRCYWRGNNPNDFISLVDQVIDSFEYDEGFGFGEGKSKLVSDAVLSGSVSEAGGIQEKAMAFIVNALIFAVCLWLGMKFTSEEGSFFVLIFISAVCSLVGLIPVAGWILSAVVMYILICKMMEIEIWPDAVIMVVVANIIANLVGFGLMASMAAK